MPFFIIALALIRAQATGSPAAPPVPLALSYINPLTDFVQADDKCYCLLPPQVVSSDTVSDSDWSGDGKALLYIRTAERPQFNSDLSIRNSGSLSAQTLCLWQVGSSQSSEIVTLEGKRTAFAFFRWLFGGNDFVVETVRSSEKGNVYELYKFKVSDPSGVLLLRSSNLMVVVPSPTQDLAIITTVTPVSQSVALLEMGGTKLVRVDGSRGNVDLESDGNVVWDDYEVDKNTKKPKIVSHPIDVLTGHILTDREAVSSGSGTTTPALEVLPGSGLAKSYKGDHSSFRSEWLVASEAEDLTWRPDGTPREALLAEDADHGTVSPVFNRVCFVSKGALFVREILEISPVLMAKMVFEAQKKEAMNKAKQIGLAILMYSNDWDDKSPTSGSMSSQIEPYLQDSSLLQGFVYTFQGASVPSGADAAGVALGYVLYGPGKAVVFADGHVVWQQK